MFYGRQRGGAAVKRRKTQLMMQGQAEEIGIGDLLMSGQAGSERRDRFGQRDGGRHEAMLAGGEIERELLIRFRGGNGIARESWI